MSSTLRQSVTARRVSQGGHVTTLFTEEIAVEMTSSPTPLYASISAETSRRPSSVNPQANSRDRRSSRCLHQIKVQPRVDQRSLSQRQLLLLTPFGASLPLGSPSSVDAPPSAAGTFNHDIPANPGSVRSIPSTQSGRATHSESSFAPKSRGVPQPKVAGSLLSVNMARSTSLPAFTDREIEANAAKDADLGLSRGDTFVWMDDSSSSDQEDNFALITPPEPKVSSSGGFAGAQAEFFSSNWEQQDRPLFANPFDNMIRSKPAPRDEIHQAPHETSPGKYNLPELCLPVESRDPPSPTRRRSSLPRYRSSPDLHSTEGSGLNIVFSSSDGPDLASWIGEVTGPAQWGNASPRPSTSLQSCVISMRRSVEDGEQTLVNLLPRLSTNSHGSLSGVKRPSLTYEDTTDGFATGIKRQSLTSQRGSWAQASFVDFSPPAVTLGREYRSRFNSVDSAMTRNSDAASLFGSFSSTDWMKPYDSKGEGWARRSTDFASSALRRGSETNARRRSSLMRTAHVNSSLTRLGTSLTAAPSETHFYKSTYRETANPGPAGGFRFGNAISNLSSITSAEKVFREEDEEGSDGGQDWQVRRRSWCEV
ncbi:hypothetical protein QFC22_001332 [Naganishia vaughanmartiniae]|uniref:Uncharacterized protein n=1 Tax=Naganishia vaughanmartiniae TaxID=1424756 RepID=A0ACC2XI81_9TREE|nr:hypothetical protein QFC22_001332 [Naganishia vaughanmartiniae]